MADGPTAEDRLYRILQLLPLATAEEGVPLADLAARLGVSEREVVRDLEEVIGRSYYRPAGDADDVTVMIEPDRVEVWTTGQFQRPVRLTPREAIALGLGLRMLAAGATGSAGGTGGTTGAHSADYRSLAEDLERGLVRALAAPEVAVKPSPAARRTTGSRSIDPQNNGADSTPPIEVSAGVHLPGALHAILTEAARDKRRCRIHYLRSGAPEPTWREIDPYALLVETGRWYVVAFCHTRECIRTFRMDRLIDVAPVDLSFEVPDSFDPRDYVSNGRVYRADADEEVAIRYAARIAPWLAESGPTEAQPDGSVIVRYSVADRRWAVRHVLEHAPFAEVVSPPDLRDAVRDALRSLSTVDE